MIFKLRGNHNKGTTMYDQFCNSIKKIGDFEVQSVYYSERGPLSLYAKSSWISNDSTKYEAMRIIERKSENFLKGLLVGGGVFTFKDNFNSRELVNFIPNAEDPRVFKFNDEIYVYYQVYNFDIGSTEIYIGEFIGSKKLSYKIFHDSLFLGKNWSPFELNKKLYFVHTFDPFFILEAPEKKKWINGKINIEIMNKRIIPKWEWSDNPERGFVTEYRGGTSGIKIDKYLYFFGHRTHRYNQLKHTIFIARFNFGDNCVEFIDLNDVPDFDLISDPFSANIIGDIINLDITLSKGFAGNPNSYTEIIELKFPISNLEKLFKEPTKKIHTNYTF